MDLYIAVIISSILLLTVEHAHGLPKEPELYLASIDGEEYIIDVDDVNKTPEEILKKKDTSTEAEGNDYDLDRHTPDNYDEDQGIDYLADAFEKSYFSEKPKTGGNDYALGEDGGDDYDDPSQFTVILEDDKLGGQPDGKLDL